MDGSLFIARLCLRDSSRREWPLTYRRRIWIRMQYHIPKASSAQMHMERAEDARVLAASHPNMLAPPPIQLWPNHYDFKGIKLGISIDQFRDAPFPDTPFPVLGIMEQDRFTCFAWSLARTSE